MREAIYTAENEAWNMRAVVTYRPNTHEFSVTVLPLGSAQGFMMKEPQTFKSGADAIRHALVCVGKATEEEEAAAVNTVCRRLVRADYAEAQNVKLLEACRLFTAAAHAVRDELNGRGIPCPSALALAAEKARNAIAMTEVRP